MAYVKKIIGHDEHIIGIARLHWIYLVRGLFAFFVFLSIGLIINSVVFKFLGLISDYAPDESMRMGLNIDTWVMPLAIIAGGFNFLFYLLKVLYSEIALTEKRIIYKRGFIFVKIHEIDIQEISGENMDMGYFGTLLGYGYILLDCRFIGDVTLPAISKANAFIKALHAARTHMSPVIPDSDQLASNINHQEGGVHSSDEKPEHEMLKPPEPKPVEEINEDGELVMAEAHPGKETKKETEVVQHDHEKEILQLEIAKLELEVKLKEIETTEPEDEVEKPAPVATAPPAPVAPVAPITAKAAQNAMPAMSKMPLITDKIAEELIAQGLIPHPDEIKPEAEFSEEPRTPKAPTDEERLEPTKTDALINSFDSAAIILKNSKDTLLKPEPAL